MAEKTNYEGGARVPMPRTWPDPSDEFSQQAAENKKPPLGIGLSERVPKTRTVEKRVTKKVTKRRVVDSEG